MFGHDSSMVLRGLILGLCLVAMVLVLASYVGWGFALFFFLFAFGRLYAQLQWPSI